MRTRIVRGQSSVPPSYSARHGSAALPLPHAVHAAARSSSTAEPDRIYRDRDTGEELQVVGKVLPLAPSQSRLPWAVENLRFCNWCDQLAQRDLNDCPTCGRRMAPLAS